MIEFTNALTGLGALLLALFGFLAGKIFYQSEKVMDQKRKSFEEFLKICPAPSEAHFSEETDMLVFLRMIGVISLYGSAESLKHASAYFDDFAKALPLLKSIDEADHSEVIKLTISYNRMVWAMRNDVMTWSVFAPSNKSKEYKPSSGLGSGQ